MNNPVNVFVTESNVEMYLSKAYECLDSERRDMLLRLLAEEESRMGTSREHVENGQRRLDDCKERVERQREVIGALQQNENRLQAEFVLNTFKKTLLLMKRHQRFLVEHFQESRL